ncbi:hypothetical protein HYH03_004887 [Edaphochlamys debaryana]|uniref:Condensin complex subunit 2 n=1 Tax=Edaphochlamys debaryana TaxID=47281 RepID=A0A836C351_9CHLO|nr:hypothetical protein HYH03_004887 [Edaphochlamys debaryana]|eukprot:KAG2497304.1 hypothetical protein HYH03_004887 [Edaphochlamys debaryana]
MSAEEARRLLQQATEQVVANKITPGNSFSYQVFDALTTLVFSERAKGENHFADAGMALDTSIRVYGKKVDYVKQIAYELLRGQKPSTKDGDGDDEEERDQGEGQEGAEPGEGGAGADAAKPKKPRKPNSAQPEATLVCDEELRQRVKEVTFDSDPFFTRTSRLIDEDSPQGLLLHSLPMFGGWHIAFDANIRPQAQDEVNTDAIPGAVVDLGMLPGARRLLETASTAALNPSLPKLYSLLQAQSGLEAALPSPQELLAAALAENDRGRMRAQHDAAVQGAVQYANDAMDVDTMDVGGGPAGPQGGEEEDFQPAYSHGGADDDDGDAGGGYAGADGGYDSPGFGGGARYDGEAEEDEFHSALGGSMGGSVGMRSSMGGAASGSVGVGTQRRDSLALGSIREEDSRADSELASMLARPATSAATAPGKAKSWWKLPPARAAAAKTRGPRAAVEKKVLSYAEWRNRPRPEPRLESAASQCFKTRKDRTAELFLPPPEPVRTGVLFGFRSMEGLPGSSSLPYGGKGGVGVFGLGGGDAAAVPHWAAASSSPLFETWRALLEEEEAKDKQERRAARATARQSLGAAGGLTPGGGAAGGPAASGTEGPFGGDGEEFGSGAGGGSPGAYDDAGDDDGGAPYYGGLSEDDNDEEEDEGAGTQRTLEELLQPPRPRVQRLAVKFDKTAGVADMAALKRNMTASLKQLAVSGPRRKSAPSPAPGTLSFQAVLDQVAATAAAASGQAGGSGGANTNNSGAGGSLFGGGSGPLEGVTTHVAFICLLHLANERGLALSNGGSMDTLLVTELGDLAAAR